MNGTPLKHDGTNDFLATNVFTTSEPTFCPLSSFALELNGIAYTGTCIFLDTTNNIVKWSGNYCKEGNFTIKVTSNGLYETTIISSTGFTA